jgi:hypothetical protein
MFTSCYCPLSEGCVTTLVFDRVARRLQSRHSQPESMVSCWPTPYLDAGWKIAGMTECGSGVWVAGEPALKTDC